MKNNLDEHTLLQISKRISHLLKQFEEEGCSTALNTLNYEISELLADRIYLEDGLTYSIRKKERDEKLKDV